MASQNQPECSAPSKDSKEWSEEELKKVFDCYKKHGAKWSKVAESFPGRSANDVKNKFYTTLKKVATRAQLENPTKYDSSFIKCKRNLIQFIDLALEHGFELSSKRGRKQKAASRRARQSPILFPEVSEGAGNLAATRSAKEQKKNGSLPPPPPRTIPNPVPSLSMFCYYPVNALQRGYMMDMNLGRVNGSLRTPYGAPNIRSNVSAFSYGGPYKYTN